MHIQKKNYACKQEENRIRQVYGKRLKSEKSSLYTWLRPDSLYMEYRKSQTWSLAFKHAGIENLETLEILDIGCGGGNWLRMLCEWGADSAKLHGVDILEHRIIEAKIKSPPQIDFQINNGWPLPFDDNSMDLCAASTVFSSIKDAQASMALAKEMMRVISKKGWAMLFDFAISHPGNPDTIGINKKKVIQLFPELNLVKVFRLILLPPLLRRFSYRMLWFAFALESLLPPLCTHRLYLLKKPS